MDKPTWICPKCANKETVILQPTEKEDGSIEFEYEGKFLRSLQLKKDDRVLYCPVCRYREIVKENKYAEVCAKSIRIRASGGVTVETIAFGVAWGIIIASVALTFFYFIVAAIILP